MGHFVVRIGDHYVSVVAESAEVRDWMPSYDVVGVDVDDTTYRCDLAVRAKAGYGTPFTSHTCHEVREQHQITFKRSDYLLQTNAEITSASIQAHDAFSFRHAMMNLYSAFVVHRQWGLLIHASCALADDVAYLFSGRSGAGKSTVARLSHPRRLLSDEASIVRIRPGSVAVLDSPFRSETRPNFHRAAVPLRAIHLLQQSPHIKRAVIPPAEAMFQLMDKVFYWSAHPSEIRKILRLYHILLATVPVYQLEFQKNNLFWEAIS